MPPPQPLLQVPLPYRAELPETMLSRSISVPALKIPPPLVLVLPFSMVTPDMVTLPAVIEKTCTALFPLIARLEAPGPLIVRFELIVSVLASVIVAGEARLKLMVSPGAAVVIAFRSDPAPLSLLFVTVMVAPKAGDALKTVSITSPVH